MGIKLDIPFLGYCMRVYLLLNLRKRYIMPYMDQYQTSHRMRDIIADNTLLLMALTRFDISLGFGDSTVADVCKATGTDCSTFLAVANFISGKPYSGFEVSLPSLVGYLRKAHVYFLDYVLPGIRGRLISAISSGQQSNVTLLILKFYDEYVEEVRRHMLYEEQHVFTYVDDLVAGRRSSSFRIADFRSNHKPIAAKLKELKEIFICHFTAERARVDMLNAVLFDIVTCERDLTTHCRVEDALFVPEVERMEEALENAESGIAGNVGSSSTALDANGDIELTPRERDIVTAIARGLSNKEIADRLFLSPHTVATHRRNICSKLNIHSASGMTIFAIIHGLISIDEGDKLIHTV